MARKTSDATVLITGPGCEGRESVSASAGLALAQNMAIHHDGDGTWYVRSPEGKWSVERQGKTVVTRRMNGEVPAPAKPVLAPEVDL